MGPKGWAGALVKAHSRKLGRIVASLVAAAVWLAAPAAHAQTETPVNAHIIEKLTLVKSDDMDFGNIVSPTAAGTVILTPNASPTCTSPNGLVQYGTCQPASFIGLGDYNRIVNINRPNAPVTLSCISTSCTGQTMNITTISFNGDPNLTYVSGNPAGNGVLRYRINSVSGLFFFRLGGTLAVNANQGLGTYEGTMTVTIQYQ